MMHDVQQCPADDYNPLLWHLPLEQQLLHCALQELLLLHMHPVCCLHPAGY
jgi:hypothetical protein